MNISSIRDMRREQFEVLNQISQLLAGASYADNLIDKALDLVIQILNAERGLFARYHPENKSFSIIAARHIDKDSIKNLSDFSSGILQRVISTGEACLYHDAQTDPDISQYKSVQIHKIKSVIGVPIRRKEVIWGVILVDSQTNRKEFSEENLSFLKFFASLVSMILDKLQQVEHLESENLELRTRLKSAPAIPQMIGDSPAMRELASLVHRVAQSDATVLLLGESGTGKELAALAIHQLSNRREKPFIAQFCGSIPDTLLESELFGYKKGAFSGAYNDKKGLFEVADHGTFFLDEIAEISPSLQAKLLRVLQNHEIIRVGDTNVKKVDIRIIAATNRDLSKLVKEDKFREDLYYRLNVFPIKIPPLRERRGDISLLTRFFLNKQGRPYMQVSKEALRKIEDYNWPGNVRQLENVLQRAAIMCDGNVIDQSHIVLEEEDPSDYTRGTLKDIEKLLLLKRLAEFNGNRTRTAESLGVSVRWIQLKLKEIGQLK
jgi:Nif-specific regulatory protein